MVRRQIDIVIPMKIHPENKHVIFEESPRVLRAPNTRGDSSRLSCLFFTF
jgi:hypothetical protein